MVVGEGDKIMLKDFLELVYGACCNYGGIGKTQEVLEKAKGCQEHL